MGTEQRVPTTFSSLGSWKRCFDAHRLLGSNSNLFSKSTVHWETAWFMASKELRKLGAFFHTLLRCVSWTQHPNIQTLGKHPVQLRSKRAEEIEGFFDLPGLSAH